MNHQQTSDQAATQREHDLATLAAGGYTGWCDETGQPAPWPDNFSADPDWRPATSTPTVLADSEQPF